jgi:hypothetical protein
MLQHVQWLQEAGAYLPSDITEHMYVQLTISFEKEFSFLEKQVEKHAKYLHLFLMLEK